MKLPVLGSILLCMRTRRFCRLLAVASVAFGAFLPMWPGLSAQSVSAEAAEYNPGTPRENGAPIAAGFGHVCVIVDPAPNGGGDLRCWGNNNTSQLGYPTTTGAMGDQPGEMGNNLPPTDIGAVKAVALTAGALHTCALRTDGMVKCWGDGTLGQLGIGAATVIGDQAGELATAFPTGMGTGRTATMISAGDFFTCALLDNGKVKCWGVGGDGQLGHGAMTNLGDSGSETGDGLPVVDLGPNYRAVSITTGASHACAVLDDGRVKCWGANASGQLGLGDVNDRGDQPNEMGANLPFVDLGTNAPVLAMTAGSAHTCAQIGANQVKCWGANGAGQLGVGLPNSLGDNANEMGANLPTVNISGGPITGLISMTESTCAVQGTSGHCWGSDAFGELFTFPAGSRNAPGPAWVAEDRIAVAGGQHFGCLLRSTGKVACWGRNNLGQLGRGTAVDVINGATVDVDLFPRFPTAALALGLASTCFVVTTSTVKCMGANFSGELGVGNTTSTESIRPHQQTAVPLPAGRTISQMAAGTSTACAVLDNGQVVCWGYNNVGQLGQGDTANRGDQPGEQPVIVPVPAPAVTKVTVGSNHVCVLQTGGVVRCWGGNASGQLGLGDASNRGDNANEIASLPAVNLGTGKTAIDVSAGANTTCAVLNDGTVKCWGNGSAGVLGTGNQTTLGTSNIPPCRWGPVARRAACGWATGSLAPSSTTTP